MKSHARTPRATPRTQPRAARVRSGILVSHHPRQPQWMRKRARRRDLLRLEQGRGGRGVIVQKRAAQLGRGVGCQRLHDLAEAPGADQALPLQPADGAWSDARPAGELGLAPSSCMELPPKGREVHAHEARVRNRRSCFVHLHALGAIVAPCVHVLQGARLSAAYSRCRWHAGKGLTVPLRVSI